MLFDDFFFLSLIKYFISMYFSIVVDILLGLFGYSSSVIIELLE